MNIQYLQYHQSNSISVEKECKVKTIKAVRMAEGGKEKSKFLSDDVKIYELSETIDAPCFYKKIGMDLLDSKPDVSSIIGQTNVDYEEVVFNCLIHWRNANGHGDGQCRELITILKECGLADAAGWLQEKQGETSKCLSKDSVLLDLSSKIDCPDYCSKLGLKLVEDKATLSNMIGGNRPPNYKEALFKCFIQWRNREGSSLESSRKLRNILRKRKLGITVTMLENLEPGLRKRDEDTGGIHSEDSEQMGTRDLEAGIHCENRMTPDRRS